MSASAWQPAETRHIAEIIKDIDICMLVTRAGGTVRGRPMSNNRRVEYDGDSWFFSYRETPKIREIEADPNVELAYVATDKGAWVSIEGTAQVVEEPDRKRELWDDSLKAWFDGGPDDERLVLLKVAADRIHAWADGKETVVEAGGQLRTIEAPSA